MITPESVNFHFLRGCNYQCKYCFHANLSQKVVDEDRAFESIRLLKEEGMKKINFSGGEPFLQPKLLGEMCKYAKSLNLAVSIISNGSKLTREWMEQFSDYVDMIGISADSFCDETNREVGRYNKYSKVTHCECVLRASKLCDDFGIKFKLNSVVSKANIHEDLAETVKTLNVARWKLLELLELQGENSPQTDIEDSPPARTNSSTRGTESTSMKVSPEEFEAFVQRQREILGENAGIVVPESSELMQNSYIILNENCCFLNCVDGEKRPTECMLEVGVQTALEQAGFDEEMFHKRGGRYDYFKEKSKKGLSEESADRQHVLLREE